MENNFTVLSTIIKKRRSIKPAQMNGKPVPDAYIHQILELADWAPTHGNTEPWKFFVFAGEAARSFSRDHAELYRNNTSPLKFEQGKYDKLLHNGDNVSHIIIAAMRRGNLPKIPVIEEQASVAASVQNI